MSKTGLLARWGLVSVVIAALGVLLLPQQSARALATSGIMAAPTPVRVPGARLERAWERQQRIHDRLAFMFDHVQRRIERAQELIDRAKTNGKDVTALQSALDAFADAVKKARPVYESTKGIIASHQGFDAGGKVTDLQQAKQTVADMGEKLKEIRDILEDQARALREAIRTFRNANRPS